jgi:hypothetical protein
MSEEARKRGREFAMFLQSLPEADRFQGNDLQRSEAEAQHREFQAHFRAGTCFLCNEALATFKSDHPCLHWLLRPPGFTKRHFMDIARRYSCFDMQTFLRWVASEEAFAKNINDLPEEGTGKLIELTIRYKIFEWSFSCAESDYLGHATESEESRRPHYHFQMRANKQAFIRFNDFHVPLLERDIWFIEAQRFTPGMLRLRISGGPGMGELLDDNIIEHLVMNGTSEGTEEDAPIELNTMIVADEGATISGDDLANLIEEARSKRVPVSSLVHKLPNARVGAVAICVGIDFGAVSSVTKLPDHAARSIV